MKSLVSLWMDLLAESGERCNASTTHDSKRAEGRIENEGLSFLTITLARFGSDFQKDLDRGAVAPTSYAGFRRRGGLPLFLGGFLERVFDRYSGRLLDDPCIESILAIRQLTLSFSKILLPCSPAREKAAIQGYIECEQEVRKSDSGFSPELRKEFRRMSLLLFGEVLSKVDREVSHGNLWPKHGPGKTADRLLGNKKFDQKEWTLRLERVFPYGENAIPNWRWYHLLDRVDFLEPGRERPVKVVLVPKTLKTPRVIAIEPTCMQYMQQAVSGSLVRKLEDSAVADMIGFTDQAPNQRMAREGSRHGHLATLDMKEASDRVSNQHVRELFAPFGNLREAIDATRSRKADVPGHGVIRLAKYASMGSALCFPVEAMVFLTIVMLALQQKANRRFSAKDIQSYRGRVRVYGDDIIVPVDSVSCVIEFLESFGLKVNIDKSFWTGKFRESCGGDYYDGHEVNVVKVRRVMPTSRRDVPEILSLVSLRNQLYHAGYWQTVRGLDKEIVSILGYFPVVMPESPAIGRHSFLGYFSEKEHPTLHKPMVKAWKAVSKSPPSRATDFGALVKSFLNRGDEPFADRKHLERSGRPDAVSIKLGWVSAV